MNKSKLTPGHVYYSPDADWLVVYCWMASEVHWFETGGNAFVVSMIKIENLVDLGALYE